MQSALSSFADEWRWSGKRERAAADLSGDPSVARDELDYTDMIALSGMFRRWAMHEAETRSRPPDRTRLIELSADYERLAEWVGPEWKASYPSPHPPLTKFLATLERSTSNVTDFMEARRILRGR